MVALDTNGDGFITESEFTRLCDPTILVAAQAQAGSDGSKGQGTKIGTGDEELTLDTKVEAMWEAMPQSRNHTVERIACWNIILSDMELANLVGNTDAARGEA